VKEAWQPRPCPPEAAAGRPYGAIISLAKPAWPPMLVYMDEDIEKLSREELIGEIRKLRAGIRAHRDSSGQDLCWHHPQLWDLLPEKTVPEIAVPAWPQFLRGCLRYRESLDTQQPKAPRISDEPEGPAPG
jgi:hypothetical protein